MRVSNLNDYFVCVSKLDLIVDLIGAPDVSDLTTACDAAKRHLLRRPRCQPDIKLLYALSSDCDHEVVHLLCQLLVFNPVWICCISYG